MTDERKQLGRPPEEGEPKKATPLMLTAAVRDYFRRVGNGNMSEGARIVAEQAMARDMAQEGGNGN